MIFFNGQLAINLLCDVMLLILVITLNLYLKYERYIYIKQDILMLIKVDPLSFKVNVYRSTYTFSETDVCIIYIYVLVNLTVTLSWSGSIFVWFYMHSKIMRECFY